MAYSDKVIDHYKNPRNVGSIDKSDPNVGTGMVGAPECGDVMKLQVKVNPETGVIEDAKFKTFGCGSAIASSCLATEWLKGKTVDEALAIKNTDIVNELSLPPVKIHCSVLAEDAIKAAIGDYKKKSQRRYRSCHGSARASRDRQGIVMAELMQLATSQLSGSAIDAAKRSRNAQSRRENSRRVRSARASRAVCAWACWAAAARA